MAIHAKQFRSLLSLGARNIIVFQENRKRLLISAEQMHEALNREVNKDNSY